MINRLSQVFRATMSRLNEVGSRAGRILALVGKLLGAVSNWLSQVIRKSMSRLKDAGIRIWEILEPVRVFLEPVAEIANLAQLFVPLYVGLIAGFTLALNYNWIVALVIASLFFVLLVAMIIVFAIKSFSRSINLTHTWIALPAIILLTLTSTITWAALSKSLHDGGVLGYEVLSGGVVSLPEFVTFYAWHLLDAIPLFGFTKTFNIGLPVQRSSVGTGVLLVVFQGFVIAPILIVLQQWWVGSAVLEGIRGEEDERVLGPSEKSHLSD